jgi:ribulose kinase
VGVPNTKKSRFLIETWVLLLSFNKAREAAFSWVKHCDWLPALLTGKTDPLTLKRSRSAAGHKALWHASWHGLPAEEFLVKLDLLLKDCWSFYRGRHGD